MDNNDQIGEAIETLVRRLKENENPETLNFYRKEYKRLVPLNLRGYLSALLLKDYVGSQDDAPPSSDRSEMRSIFVSIGKNRRVFPKDLAKHFSDHLGIDQSSIGSVKVLDSYSFIEIPTQHADRAIKELDDTEYRGRTIAVNNARKRR